MFRIIKLSSGLLLLFISFAAYALKEDLKEKLYIVADATNYNYKTGINIYEGHVKVDQGTSHIRADKLITKNNLNHQIQEVIAYGISKPAEYWTLPNPSEPVIHAKANIIKFYPLQSNVTLQQNVLVTQGENSFKGELILYNKSEQTIIVPASTNGHAILVYNPDK